MKRALAYMLPILIACTGACAHRHEANRQIQLNPNEAKPIRKDLEPNGTPNPHASSGTGTVRTEPATIAGAEPDTSRDQKITEHVRRAIMEEKSLSPDAKNVTISTDEGVVKLEGPVASKREQKLIAEKATQVAGVIRVDNQTEVRPVH